MRKSLNQDQMREIADLFASVMPSDTKRDAILALAFSRYPKMLGSIDRSGAGFIFSVNLIAFLNNFGDVERDVPALRVMMEGVRDSRQLGEDQQTRINALIAQIFDGTPSASRPGSTDSPQTAITLPTAEKIKILFMAANPRDTGRIHVDEELNRVDDVLLRAELRNRFELIGAPAVRVSQLQEFLLRYKPQIVHIAGHGNPNGELVFNDEINNAQTVPIKALANLFSILKKNIRCVVLNACYSEAQAVAIVESIDVALGMSVPIGDNAAIQFSSGFYRGLAAGEDVPTSFALAKNQMELSGRMTETTTPQIKYRAGINPEHIFKV
ncbi:MAG: CHAT domain-containing protein [Chloroflexota bacterium]|nr:CHAT domain-containing protein [Chloroflexota bacterium]